MRGVTLREIEDATKLSNSYLSQLENEKVKTPSPHVLYKLAKFYEVPYERLMELTGYVWSNSSSQIKRGRDLGALEALLMSARLSEEEEEKIIEFIKFIRAQRQDKRQR